MVLIYKKAKGLRVRVQQSSDLISWTFATSTDIIIGKSAGVETVKSTVPMGAFKRLFFRVPVTLYRDVTLAWEGSLDPTVTGYRLYYGSESGIYTSTIDVGNQTFTTVSIPQDARPYYFVVTAYTYTGVESLPSAEVVCLWEG